MHGECDHGDSQCGKCYDGWKGRMCDIPTENRPLAHIASVDDEEQEEAIFRPKKIRDSD